MFQTSSRRSPAADKLSVAANSYEHQLDYFSRMSERCTKTERLMWLNRAIRFHRTVYRHAKVV